MSQESEKSVYFASSNSGRGFHSYFREIFGNETIARLYILKGGPGTGKSRFLREIGEEAEKRKLPTERYACSSDPDSLDGIIVEKKNGERVAVIDGTAPHTYDETLPGVKEEIVNLGSFWDAGKLTEEKEKIGELWEAKKRAWKRAYSYLAACGEMNAIRDGLVRESGRLKLEKIKNAAARLLEKLPMGEGGETGIAITRSVGMKGESYLETYLKEAKTAYRIEDFHGCGYLLAEEIAREANRKRLKIKVSHHPIWSDCVDGVYLKESGIAFAVCRGEETKVPCKVIRTARFLPGLLGEERRKKIRYAERMREAMLAGAVEELREAGRLHFAIEKCYIGAMNFEEKENFTKEFCRKLFEA